MLIFEQDGWLEVETREIRQLCRSTAAVVFADTEQEPCEVHAVFCQYLDNAELRCRVALYAKALKRALIFTVKESAAASSWEHGRDLLVRLGFQLEEVNLKLSPALLDVVLRDIPGLTTPAEARRLRHEKALLLADLQAISDREPGSAAGKKAALKLNAEKLLHERTQDLRKRLEALLRPADAAVAEQAALNGQIQELTTRLESAEARAAAERQRRSASEAITAAAEKRIQELEEILVEVETRSADAVKQQRKLVELQGRVTRLKTELATAEQAIHEGEKTRTQLIADARAADQSRQLLQDELQTARQSLAKLEARLAGERADRTGLDSQLQAAQERITVLEQELAESGRHAALHADAAQASGAARAQLAESQQALREARERNRILEKDREVAVAERETLSEALHEAHGLIDSLEKMVRQMEQAAADGHPLAAAVQDERQVVPALEEKLKSLEGQLAQQRAEQDRLAAVLAATERQLAERLETAATERADSKEHRLPAPAVAEAPAKPARPLPHELRPAPKKDAFFRPDWDLAGLPCRSVAQVHKAWETVANVQISLEGYPSQYCMAFLVVLRVGKQKKLYLLFRLKQSRHTLVCVPTRVPKDEASLQKAVAEGLRYLKMSGFQMEEMAAEHIDSALGSYFQPA